MLSIDFETYSEVDLTKVGGYVYAQHPSTEVTLMAVSEGGSRPQLIDFTRGEEIPGQILAALNDETTKVYAYNAEFEWLMFNYVLKIEIPYSRFICSMAAAWRLGFTGSMKDVQAQIGVSEADMKQSDGRSLVLKFCKPAPANRKVKRYDESNSPEDWHRFREYCIQDVIAEQSIWSFVKKYQ